jgi:hypothetical protein
MQLNSFMWSQANTWGDFFGTTLNYGLRGLSDFSQLAWREARIWGDALGMGMMQLGRGWLNFQQNFFKFQMETYKMMGQGIYTSWKGSDGINRYWPKWSEVFMPGYGNYGGPFRTDPNFNIKPVDSMDNLFMKHDAGWFRNDIKMSDRIALRDLYSLPSNPRDWQNPPRSPAQATFYRKVVAEPYFWWRNVVLQDDN